MLDVAVAAGGNVSIHAPVMGAKIDVDVGLPDKKFQSTHP